MIHVRNPFRNFFYFCVLSGLFIGITCGPKPGQKGYVKKAHITGSLKDVYGDPLPNIPLRFEVLTPVPGYKGFLRTVTDTGGMFSFYWDELIRKESLKPMYILHLNYARDYLRNDKYEYLIRKCTVKPGEASSKVSLISPVGNTDINIKVGHHLWVEADQSKVRTGPSIQEEDVAVLYRATKVIMVDQKGEWCLVKIPTNDLNSFPIYDKSGWVYKPLLSEQYIPPVSYKERQRNTIIKQHLEWSSHFVEMIKKGKVDKGMTKEMVRASMGDPVNTIIDDSDKKDIITKWEYGTIIKKVITFKDDKVESWE